MSARRLGVAGALVGGMRIPGDVVVAEGEIVQVGARPAGAHGLAVPGFVDLQVNGFAGVDFLVADVQGYRHAADALAATGVTAYQPTLISSPPEAYPPALKTLAAAQSEAGGPRILGAHLEGPFLAPAFAGAHNPDNLRAPDPSLAEWLCDAGPVGYMTLAPERPGGLELVTRLVRRGVVVALGHSDADAPTAHAAYDRGARAVTHLHNAQRRWRSRDPGLSGVALTRADVCVQVILDGIHLAAETSYGAFLAATDRFALVTDAIAAAGMADGTFVLGDRTVQVADGAARLADGTLAGSVLTMDQAVRNLVELGAPLPEAAAAATSVPATLVGRAELASLRPGTLADVTVLGERLEVHRTLIGGAEAYAC